MRNPWIGCPLLGLRYDFEHRSAVLLLPPRNCTDMRSAIRYVRKRFGGVRSIMTIAGDVPDIIYETDEAGQWFSIDLRRARERAT